MKGKQFVRPFLFAGYLLLLFLNTNVAQIQIGTVSGSVFDSVGTPITGARVALQNPLTGSIHAAVTDTHGIFLFNNVPFAQYRVRVEANNFRPAMQSVIVRSNLPIKVDIQLTVAGTNESVTVAESEALIRKDSSSTDYQLEENFIARLPSTNRSRQLQALLATTPGWTTENNGLLHIRGVDDGILYVIDGIPTIDRLDALFAGSPDIEMIHSIEVITGNIPAEFGGRSGAVVTLQPKSGIDRRWFGSFTLGASSFMTREISSSIGGGFHRRWGFFVSGSGMHSNRFLDPVDERNLHNRGGSGKFNLRSDWHPTDRDILFFNVSANGTDLRVPNHFEQELAGQRQRQELRDNSQSISWQRVWSTDTVTNLAGFRRYYESRLFGSEFDTPITATQDRKHTRVGLIASLTRFVNGHTLKFGTEASRLSPDEFFSFAVTNRVEAEKNGVSEAASEFDRDHPFIFRETKKGHQISLYAQDSLSPVKNLTVNAGLRFDHYNLKVSDSQLSPRIGAVYHIPKTRTAIRASFNRLFMPPQIENLLLADSEQARQLSPFAGENGGGELIRPEKTSAYEFGFEQDIVGLFKLDAAYWYRTFRNFDDPNVFFNTTIIFPNSVFKGFGRGVDVRLDIPRRRGWAGYASFTNQRILQTGPINGGLFLTDEFIEIGAGVDFIPDHDQRNVLAFGASYEYRRFWTSMGGRHESGTPLEVDEDEFEDLRQTAGSDLVDFDRARVKPYTIFNFAAGVGLVKSEHLILKPSR